MDNVIPVTKAITWLLRSRLQGNKPHRNFPEPSEPYLLNLRQHTPEPSEIFRNLPGLASGTYTILQRNSPEPSGTCLRNLHHSTKELSGTFRNPPPEPTPAHSGTLRNLPEPSGTFLRSLSGLKTPLAYAVGEKCDHFVLPTETHGLPHTTHATNVAVECHCNCKLRTAKGKSTNHFGQIELILSAASKLRPPSF